MTVAPAPAAVDSILNRLPSCLVGTIMMFEPELLFVCGRPHCQCPFLWVFAKLCWAYHMDFGTSPLHFVCYKQITWTVCS